MLIEILISRLGGGEMIEELNRKAIQLTFGQGRTFMRFEIPEGNSAVSLREQTIGNWPAYTAVVQSKKSHLRSSHGSILRTELDQGNAFDL
jgi:hypothetical protein